MSKCYMCDQTAVGDEHVPPRCLFPKAKDLPNGVDLRKDLITVLSCADHNSEKSREGLAVMQSTINYSLIVSFANSL